LRGTVRPRPNRGNVFEERAEPGAAWGSAGIASPERADCLASYVIEAGVLGGQHYVAAWATPEVGKVTVRATPASAVQTLPFHAVPGASLRIAGAWLADFRPGSSTVTFYDRAGAVITAYPKGRAGNSAEPSGADAVVRTRDPCQEQAPARARRQTPWEGLPGRDSLVVAHPVGTDGAHWAATAD
jgi:hypothetical protein